MKAFIIFLAMLSPLSKEITKPKVYWVPEPFIAQQNCQTMYKYPCSILTPDLDTIRFWFFIKCEDPFMELEQI